MQYLPFYIWIKCMILKMITLCPKVLGKFGKKEHQNVIETRKFSGWGRSGDNRWMANVLICLSNIHNLRSWVLTFWTHMNLGVGRSVLGQFYCGSHKFLAPYHCFLLDVLSITCMYSVTCWECLKCKEQFLFCFWTTKCVVSIFRFLD